MNSVYLMANIIITHIWVLVKYFYKIPGDRVV